MKSIGSLVALVALLGACSAPADPTAGGSASSLSNAAPPHTAADFLASNARPVVIGHEGAGENFGADTTKPINDTVDSVRLAYQQGAAVVEVDAELTKDGQVVAYHDFDFLPDYSCINSYTLDELQAKVPYIPSLQAVLNQARLANRNSTTMGGIMIVELKTPSPLCDPGDTSEQALVSAVVKAVHDTQMDNAVMFDGFSPALLYLASQAAPNIPRELDLDLLQLMTPAQVTANTGMPVTEIQKNLSLGFQWADVGVVYRLPGYTSVTDFFTAAFITGSRIVGVEKDFIGYSEQTQPGSVAQFVGAAHYYGFKAYADPAKTVQEFGWYASFGFDAAYCDDIPASLALQPPL
ncbi:MAG TPA: glycerophosphodiester phosphodiesterase [Polyangiaceae bacterium]|nr:glycerophosphodiester phosphodiesterase [Polyangiaceae bacterium]